MPWEGPNESTRGCHPLTWLPGSEPARRSDNSPGLWAVAHSSVLRVRWQGTTVCRSSWELTQLGVGRGSLCATLPPPGLIHNSCLSAQTKQDKQTNTVHANAKREATLGESRCVKLVRFCSQDSFAWMFHRNTFGTNSKQERCHPGLRKSVTQIRITKAPPSLQDFQSGSPAATIAAWDSRWLKSLAEVERLFYLICGRVNKHTFKTQI